MGLLHRTLFALTTHSAHNFTMRRSQAPSLKRQSTLVLTRAPSLSSKRSKAATNDVTVASRGATYVSRGPRRAELKRTYQLPVSAIALSNVWLMHPFGEIVSGDDMYSRDGRAVRHHFTQWALRLTKNPAYAQTQVRLILLVWKQAKTTPTPIDIITDVSGVLATTSAYQINNSDNYQILVDKIIDLSSHAQALGAPATGFGECIKTIDGVFKYNKVQTYYDNTLTSANNFRYYSMMVSQFASSVSDVRLNVATTFSDV